MYTLQEQESPQFDHFHIDNIWNRTQKHNGKDISKWLRVDNIEQVTTLVSGILIKHFGQSNGTPFANAYWKARLSDAELQQNLLDGNFSYDNSLPPEANTLLKSFTLKPNVKEIPLIPTWEEFTLFIQNATEKHHPLLPVATMGTIKLSYNLHRPLYKEFMT